MSDSKNKQSSGFFSNAIGVAKKLSSTGIHVLQQVAPGTVAKDEHSAKSGQIIEGQARSFSAFQARQYDNPQHMLRQHVPQVSRQLLGRHYNRVNQVASFVSPDFSDKISDYLFDQLNSFTSNISSVDDVLDQAGVRDLEELTQDVDRSKRISQALAEQNKWIASLQGALTGATGVIGSTIDVPASIVMSLRTIYQVGRAYGFELNKDTEQEIVQFIFKQIDLGVIAEKQAVLMGLKTLSNMLQTHDVHQLQNMLGSSNDYEVLKKYFLNEQGQVKWPWLNHVPKFSMLNKLTPVATASVSAVYSWKLVEDVHHKAQQVFSNARSYLIQHKDSNLSAIHAYEKSLELLAQAAPKLLEQLKGNEAKHAEQDELVAGQERAESAPSDALVQTVSDHESIRAVKVQKKSDKVETTAAQLDENIQQGLEELADQMLEPHAEVASQKPAVPAEEIDEYMLEDALEPVEDSTQVAETVSENPVTSSKETAKQVTKKPRTRTSTRKPKAE